MSAVTIFKNIFSKEPHYISVADALKRIQGGNSKHIVEEVRNTLDKEKANKVKLNLPSVCFSGKFGADRKDEQLLEHSGFIVLDFDDVEDLRSKQEDIIQHDFVYACWISPSGKGLKVLIKIAKGEKHREHFQALQEVFPEIDRSGINVSRVCYESFDADIYINDKAKIFKKVKKIEQVYEKQQVQIDYEETFRKLLKWITNKGDAFVTGERNIFIFKLASACCRFGIDEMSAQSLIGREFLNGSDFTTTECNRAIKSAYKSNASKAGSAIFDKDVLVDRVSRSEIKVDETMFDENIRPKDVIYGVDVKDKAMNLYDNGYEKVLGLDIPEMDERFKPKRGEIVLLTGIGNYGKSSWKRWYQVFRALKYGEKFATFSPEDNPAEEYYHELVEIVLGCDCTPSNINRPNRDTYERAYDFITKHFFYLYPKNAEPTPQYIKERFLELIVKENVDGCDIDPFNQLSNNYKDFAGRDKYLEFILTDFQRFAIINQVFFWIVAHPIKMVKASNGNYPCPDVFDIADGSMWNNKMDCILVYHRPFAQTEPQNPIAEFHSKKIRRQKVVGKKGFFLFDMVFSKRRFMFDNIDHLQILIKNKNLYFDGRNEEVDTVFAPHPMDATIPIENFEGF